MKFPEGLNVCNEALAKLGQDKHMESVDTESTDPIFRNLAMLYETSRRDVLLEHPWNFTGVVRPCAFAQTGPCSYVIPLPGDCLRVLSLMDLCGNEVAHERVGSNLITERPASVIKYQRDDCEPDCWDPWVRRLLVSRLAANFSRPLKGSMSDRNLQEQEYKLALAQAIEVNGTEDTAKRKPSFARRVIEGDR